MNNKDFYKNVMSGVRPSEQTVERIINMADTDIKKRNILKPILAVAVCVALIATEIFAGGVLSKKPLTEKNNNSEASESISRLNNVFILTAYAENGEEVKSITDSGKYTIQNSKINAYYDNDGIYVVEMSGKSNFEVKGDNIKSVRYQCKNGSFGHCVDFNKIEYLKEQNKYYDAIVPYSEDLQKLSDDELTEKVFENCENGKYDEYFKEKKPVSAYLKAEKIYNGEKIIGIGFLSAKTYQSVSSGNNCNDFTYINYLRSEEFLNYTYWSPDTTKLFGLDGKASGISFDELEHDTFKITVEFNDGSLQTQSYDLGFNKNGNLEIQKIT
ncbi:MAG: hypothetical protein KBT46_03890 [Ruminococcus sp.]|nr:hypothetical protein [Candidatus Copronaster equi]